MYFSGITDWLFTCRCRSYLRRDPTSPYANAPPHIRHRQDVQLLHAPVAINVRRASRAQPDCAQWT
jgi:hypothetical protein